MPFHDLQRVSMHKYRQGLDDMAKHISKGEFEKAASIGNGMSKPLGVSDSDLQVQELLADRQTCKVHRGRYKGQRVAVKKAKITTTRDLEHFRKEIYVMLQLDHPHVVSLLAARLLPPDYLVLLDLGAKELAHELHEQGWRPKPAHILRIARQLAGALAYVHSKGILHRDVNPSNILLDDRGDLKLGDFSIADMEADLAQEQANRNSLVGKQPTGGFHKRHLVGTLQYLSPEVLQKRPAGYASDVYAWAVTINEVATGVFPFSDCTKDNPKVHTVLDFGYGRSELAAAVAAEGLRPTQSDTAPAGLNELLTRCWHLDPAQRPSAQDLVAELDGMREPGTPDRTDRGAEGSTSASKVQADGHAANAGTAASRPSPSDNQREPWHAQVQVSPKFKPKITAGAHETAGRRGEDKMEDRHIIASPLHSDTTDTHVLAIFDGHRGVAAAEHCTQSLLQHIQSHWKAESAETLLQEAFFGLDHGFQEQQDKEWEEEVRRKGGVMGSRPHAGCTIVVALLHHNHLWIANAGDCRAVMVRGGKAEQLSRAHTADDDQERGRIEQADPHALMRIGDGWRVAPAGLQVTRSIGDLDLKSRGVTAEPETSHVELTADHTCLIMGSDGLWDYLSNQAAADLVRDTVKEPSMSAQRLVTEALTNGSGDNITAIVAFLQPVSTLERIYG